MNTKVKILLIILICSHSLKVFSKSILDDNLAALPEVSIENNINLDFDFKSGTLIWVNKSLSTSNLTLFNLLPDISIDNFSSKLSNDSSTLIKEVLKTLQIENLSNGKRSNSANHQFNTVISNLMLVSKQRKNSGFVPEPDTIMLVMMGLVILLKNIKLKNKTA